MAKVFLEKIYKRYGKIETVHGIDLEINDNEFIVLVGPSGCGKSTTLRMIAGLEDISDGTLRIGDRVVNDVAPKDRNIAMVFQNYALYPHMNVYDNMGFGLKLSKMPKDEIDKRVRNAAEILGLTALLDRKPAAMSGGQRQRVAMGRAIVRNPQVFLFDEPLSNLDAQLRTQMRMEIKKLHMRVKTTTIYVTHDQIEAMTLADRIVILRDGYIEQVGSPLEVFEHPANIFVARFIGNPPMNILDGTIRKDMIEIGKVKFPIPEKAAPSVSEGMAVKIGLRPDDISIAHADDGFPENWKYDGVVEVAEPLGGKALFDLKLGGNEMVAEVETRTLPAYGSTMKFSINFKHLHVFDPKNEKTISN